MVLLIREFFECLKQDGCHNHSKNGHLYPVFEWSTSLDHFMYEKSHKNIFLLYNMVYHNEPFENWTGIRIIKDHSKTRQIVSGLSPLEYRTSPTFKWSLFD
jgi:hypothetical protein